MCQEPPFRCETAAAVRRLSVELALLGYGQDWGIENAQPERVEEFLDAYERMPLDDDERFALMALIVGSYDDLLDRDADEQALWTRIRGHLIREFALHAYTVFYWSRSNKPDPGNDFMVTPRIREVWERRGEP